MKITFEANPFWNHSLQVYGGEGVSAACIALQDRHGLDVNLILYCLWIGQDGGGVLGAPDFDRLIEVSGDWNANVIQRLRAARLAIKTGFEELPTELRDSFRKRILAIEIDGERAEQFLLGSLLDRPRDATRDAEGRARDSAANLWAYLSHRSVSPGDADIDDLAVILAAACPDTDRARLLGFLAENI
ncbi:MAG: TIGR02444 family protein [Alphaproteobacteria bacterium]